jgi:replicative DNA helicase
VDYLQLMRSTGRVTSREQEVSEISRGLKGLAKEFEVPVVALSQLSRAGEGRTDKTPKLSDLRESGSIEQDADVVLFLHRPDMHNIESTRVYGRECSTKNLVQLIIGKQRNGPIGFSWLSWDPEATRMTELDDSRVPDEAPLGQVARGGWGGMPVGDRT